MVRFAKVIHCFITFRIIKLASKSSKFKIHKAQTIGGPKTTDLDLNDYFIIVMKFNDENVRYY